ncbi:MAG: TolC family protein [Bacteroidota bacterium]
MSLLPWSWPRSAAWTLTVLLSLVGAVGCSFVPASRAPEPVAALPDAFAQEDIAAAETLAVYDPQAWWTGFADPVLNRLVDSTLTGNLDLAEAEARVDQVAAQARIARAALFPGLNGTGSASAQNQSATNNQFSAFQGGGDEGGEGEPPGGEAGPTLPDRLAFEQYSVALAASYELDFWGRVRNETRAAYASAAATAADLQTARLSVIAGVVSTYFEVVDLRQRIALTLATVDLLAERVDLTEERYTRGLVGSFELYRILQDYRTTQASLPVLEADLTDAEGRLAVLAGRYAGRLGPLLPDTLVPALALDPVPPGQPADLLLQRPDVRAAAYRFEAARYTVGARKAALLPSVALTGQLGIQGLQPDDLLDLDNWFSSLTANLTMPLFQGGRLRANVSAAEAAYAQQAAAYGRTVLTAFQEVESALERYEEERQRFDFLRDQLTDARDQDTVQTTRFEQGIGDYTAVLDAQRNRLQVLTSLSGARRSVALARLGVYRALGGTWVAEPPELAIDLVDAPVALPND